MHNPNKKSAGNIFYRFIVIFIIALIWLTESKAPNTVSAAGSNDFIVHLKTTSFEPEQYIPIPPAGLGYNASESAAAGVYLVQFTGPVLDGWKQQLLDAGAQLGPYIPNYAFIVQLNSDALTKVKGLSFVRWVGIYQPAYRLASNIDSTSARSYKLTLAPWANINQLKSLSSTLGASARISSQAMNAVLDASGLNLMARRPDVLWIEPYYINKAYNNVGGATIMNASTAWSNGYTGTGITVAVADTGLDTGTPATMHLDFMNGGTPRVTNISSWPVASMNLGSGCYATNAGADDGASDKSSGHGTHVTGSVAGNGARSSGAYKGLAYNSSITFQAVEQYVTWSPSCASRGFPNGYYLAGIPDDVRTLLSEVYNWGARVQNDSWGGGEAGVYDQQAGYFDDFTFNHQDFTVVVAAGNDGADANHDGYVDNGSVNSPATAKNVITVGATENNRPGTSCFGSAYTGYTGCTYNQLWGSDFGINPTRSDIISNNPGQMAAFSSRGPTADGRIRPDVAAPGTDIISTHSSQTAEYGWGPVSGNGYYEYMGGTSMASPLTAGAAALVRQFLIDHESIANPTAALIKALLVNTAVDIPGYGNSSYEAGAPIPNNSEGWGRVDVGAATNGGRIVLDGVALSTGASFDSFYMVNAGAPLKVTLAWSDYPAAASAGVTLVNDLNLKLTAPDETTYYWGNVFSGGWSAAGGSADNRNNLENVYIQNPGEGLWRVQIIGQNIPNGPQPYALVLSGNIAAPADFNKISPVDGATGESLTPTLNWETSTGAARYEYCIDTNGGDSCNSAGPWTSTLRNTSITLPTLSGSQTYYWQVRAWNGRGYTYANAGAGRSFTTQGSLTPAEIVVEGPGSVNIADGGLYNLGTTTVGTPLTRTITVHNTGAATLNLLSNPPTTTGNFSAGSFGSASLNGGASTTFNLTCNATSSGSPVSGTVSFANNDSDENPFDFTVTCTVNPGAAPEIVVKGPGSVNIDDGGTFDLGMTAVGAPLTRTISVRNTGTAILNLLTNPPTTTGDFTAGSFGSTSVNAGGSTTFSLTCNAASAGWPVSGTVSFANNDSDENPFNFTVTCTAAVPENLVVNIITDTDDGSCDITNCSLREAINAANDYPGVDSITFNVNGTILLGSRLPEITSAMTIDGQGRTIAIDGQDEFRGFTVDINGNLTLDTVTVQNGSAAGAPGEEQAGGGIRNSGSLTLAHVTVSNNSASYEGGGILNTNMLTISDTTISGNSVTYSEGQTSASNGGGICNYGHLTVIHSIISGNTANYGGGIYNSSVMTMDQSTVTENLAGQGSGIYNSASSLASISGSSIVNNSYAFFEGGGLDNYYATMSVTGSEISGNSSGFGGGVRNTGGSLTLLNSSLFDNSSTVGGGGAVLVSHNGTVNIENSTLSDNSCFYCAGGIAVDSGSVLTATQTTFSGNTGSTGTTISVFAGAEAYPAGTAYLAGTVMESELGARNCDGVFTDNGYNLSNDGSCAFTAIGSQDNAVLNLGELANNGGPTTTNLPGSGSAAIDLIPNGTTISNNGISYTCGQNGEALDTDQRGEPRPWRPAGKCDAGAVEAGDKPLAPTLVLPTNNLTTTDNTPDFDWNDVGGVTQYRLEIDNNNDFASPEVTATTGSSAFTLTSALPDGSYHWRVQASNGVWSNFSSVWTVIISTTEIVVEGAGPVNITDEGVYDLGTTFVGTPLTRTITVRNSGTTALSLSTNSPAASGDFIASTFGSTTVAPGASTTFDITCNATAAGSPVSGTISFGNNDGDENPFNFTVTCTVSALSNNAYLSNLILSTGVLTPVFNSSTTTYTQSVNNSTTSLTVTPTAADPTATVKVNGISVISGSPSSSINLNVGSNTITIVVRAQDAVASKTYTVSVSRAASSNANLSNLVLSNGAISPAFNPNTTTYAQNVMNAITSLTVTPTAAEPNATVMVNTISVVSGNPSGSIQVDVGTNFITIEVTAQDGVTSKTYTVVIVRAQNSNANLGDLALSTGGLTPAFNPSTVLYTQAVSDDINDLMVTPTVADPTATVTVNGISVSSGSPSGTINLGFGPNIITIVVTAQDGITTKTYTVTVTRQNMVRLFLPFVLRQ